MNEALRRSYALIEKSWNAKDEASTIIKDGESYIWGIGETLNAVEASRQLIQNRIPNGWGPKHKEFHRLLHTLGLTNNPTDVTSIGVGVDARLLINMSEVYDGVTTVHGIESIKQRLSEAEESMREANSENFSRFRFHPGNAAMVLSSLPANEVVDVQLMFIHLTKPEMQSVVGAIADNLTPKGILTVGDLEIRTWDAKVAPGYEKDPKVQKLVTEAHNFIHGDGKFPGAIAAAWGGRAHPWEGSEHIAQTIAQYSKGRLLKVRNSGAELATENTIYNNESEGALLAAHIAPTIALSVRLAQMMQTDELIKQRMGFVVDELFRRGPLYVQALQHPGILTVVPTMHWQAFRKVR